jgi:hypothetical protein
VHRIQSSCYTMRRDSPANEIVCSTGNNINICCFWTACAMYYLPLQTFNFENLATKTFSYFGNRLGFDMMLRPPSLGPLHASAICACCQFGLHVRKTTYCCWFLGNFNVSNSQHSRADKQVYIIVQVVFEQYPPLRYWIIHL